MISWLITGVACLVAGYFFAKSASKTRDKLSFSLEILTSIACLCVGLLFILFSIAIWLTH